MTSDWFHLAGWPEDEALAALRILAAALSAQPNLRSLNLSDNALGEKGVRAFAAGLSNQVTGNLTQPCSHFDPLCIYHGNDKCEMGAMDLTCLY